MMKKLRYISKVLIIYFKSLRCRIIGKKVIVLRASVALNRSGIRHNNWGDDLNYYMLQQGTDVYPLFIPHVRNRLSQLKLPKHYLLIGSILSFYNLDNAIVCGSGLIDPNREVTGKPKKIFSVRGPLTRQALLKKGIECPECYGDPALLLPHFYSPQVTKLGGVFVIPHVDTENTDCETLDEVKRQGYTLLSMRNYNNWTDIIDKICSADYVLSESLHGLIVAEAYGIPCVWVELKEHPLHWDFKFRDFYESIGKLNMQSLKLYKSIDMKAIQCQLVTWKPGKINLNEMLKYFPFELKVIYRI